MSVSRMHGHKDSHLAVTSALSVILAKRIILGCPNKILTRRVFPVSNAVKGAIIAPQR